MKFAITQSSLAGRNRTEMLCRAAAVGADGLELDWRSPLDSWSANDGGDGLRLLDQERQHELVLSGLSLGYLSDRPALSANAADRAETVALVARALEFMCSVGIDTLVLPLTGRSRIETDADLDRAVELVGGAAHLADGLGCRVAVRCALSASRIHYLLDSCVYGEAVRFCPDLGEAAAKGLDAASMIRALRADQLGGVCVRDVLRRPGQPPDFCVRLGRGAVDFAGVRSALSAVGFDGWVVVDTPPGDSEGEFARIHLADARALLGSPDSGPWSDAERRELAGVALRPRRVAQDLP